MFGTIVLGRASAEHVVVNRIPTNEEVDFAIHMHPDIELALLGAGVVVVALSSLETLEISNNISPTGLATGHAFWNRRTSPRLCGRGRSRRRSRGYGSRYRVQRTGRADSKVGVVNILLRKPAGKAQVLRYRVGRVKSPLSRGDNFLLPSAVVMPTPKRFGLVGAVLAPAERTGNLHLSRTRPPGVRLIGVIGVERSTATKFL